MRNYPALEEFELRFICLTNNKQEVVTERMANNQIYRKNEYVSCKY